LYCGAECNACSLDCTAWVTNRRSADEELLVADRQRQLLQLVQVVAQPRPFQLPSACLQPRLEFALQYQCQETAEHMTADRVVAAARSSLIELLAGGIANAMAAAAYGQCSLLAVERDFVARRPGRLVAPTAALRGDRSIATVECDQVGIGRFLAVVVAISSAGGSQPPRRVHAQSPAHDVDRMYKHAVVAHFTGPRMPQPVRPVGDGRRFPFSDRGLAVEIPAARRACGR